SDSHHRIPEAGYGRTYARLDGAATPEAIATAIRDGHTVVSAGPMIHFTDQSGAFGVGDTIELGSAGDITLAIRVEAPAWIPVETVTIVGEGEELETIDVGGGGGPVWVDEERTYAVSKDTWFVVRADGTSDLGPVYPGGTPFAITSPIYVSVGGGSR
ncbi:MAG: hypothetical protein L0206_01220, partial [Actinobacteria bacterium]|nr:hypothetical protein [Actinomycetota bacterium]